MNLTDIALTKALGGGGGSEVTVTPSISSGTKIASISVDGTAKNLYAPAVTVTQTLTTGTEIGSIKVGSTTKKLYAPSGGGGGGMNILNLEIQNWGSVYVLYNTDTSSVFATTAFYSMSGMDYDAIEIYCDDFRPQTQFSLGERTRYYFAELASDYSCTYKNLNGANDFEIDEANVASSLTIGGKTFTIDSDYNCWACINENPE